MRAQAFDFSLDVNALTVAPSPYREARQTSADAAVANHPVRGAQNARILALITAAGDAGMSDEELRQATGYPRSSICARRGDLRAFLTPATRRGESIFGRPMVCWRRRTAAEMAS